MTYDKRKLFLVSLLALATAGVSFAIRGSIGDDLQTEFFNNSAELMGGAIGIAGLGYALTIAIGSPMLDYLGMGNLLSLSSVLFMIGTLVTMYAGSLAATGTGSNVEAGPSGFGESADFERSRLKNSPARYSSATDRDLQASSAMTTVAIRMNPTRVPMPRGRPRTKR